MARKKRSSKVLEKAERRAASLNSIDVYLDLGNGLSLPTYSNLIEKMRTRENLYNTALSTLDKLYREMLETEGELADMTEHMLVGVAAKFGKSSAEYCMAGGVPKNQRYKKRRGESSTTSSEQLSFVANVNNQNGNKPTITS